MNVVVVETVRGRDGKRYPVGGDLPPDQRNKARWLVHRLVHRDHHSIRAAQAIMLAEHGLRRSLGILARDLRDFQCPECADRDG